MEYQQLQYSYVRNSHYGQQQRQVGEMLKCAPMLEEPAETPIEDENRTLPHKSKTPDRKYGDDDSEDIVELNDVKVIMGRKLHHVIDTRSEKRVKVKPPKVAAGGLWADEDFPQAVAMEGQEPVDWKRPGEIAEKPVLFADGVTRFDIGQGRLGNCWFVAALASLGDKQHLVKQVVVDDYHIGTDEYRGVFHCRFWRFGEWIDVYVDDCIPVVRGRTQPWGARSRTDANEMWVPLLEKAYAKFHGSYLKVDGGSPREAFINLTGSLVENVDLEHVSESELFTTVRSALRSGSIIACNIPSRSNVRQGLIGNHVYSLTGSTVINVHGQDTMLFRMRNPWATSVGEWEGAWSDNSSEWDSVSESVKTSLKVTHKGDGEFWMEVSDVFVYFKRTYICNFVPDFNLDGAQDDLDKSCIVLGEWMQDTAAGSDFPAKFKNPRFRFSVSSKGLDQDGMVPIVLQFAQRKKDATTDDDSAYIRADLYKVEGQCTTYQPCEIIYEVTNDSVYRGDPSVTYRYRCSPGKYLIVATTMKAGQEREFMLRMFSSQPVKVRQEEEIPGRFIRRFDMTERFNVADEKAYKLDSFYGEWRGQNSGGQVRNRTFADNPQYIITVSGSAADVMLSLKQDVADERIALGIKLIRSDGEYGPSDINYLWRNYNTKDVDTSDGRGTFIIAYEASGLFYLSPGQYTAVLFLNTPDIDKEYVFTVGSLHTSNVTIEGYNTFNETVFANETIEPIAEEEEDPVIEDVDEIVEDTEEVVEPTVEEEEEDTIEIVEVDNVDDDTVILGRELVQVLDTRPGTTTEKVQPPRVEPGTLWVDSEFPQYVAMEGQEEQVQWHRPMEFVETPVLFSSGTTRFDVGQGRVGNCWFLAALASVSEKPHIIKQVIVDDYNIGSANYKGVFHCRFWRFGEWIDVYVDDHIPTMWNQPWGARSTSDPNEMWVPLLEKAFAKFHGSYLKVEGGQSSAAYVNLTGGMVETVKHDDVSKEELYERVNSALRSGSLVVSNVPGTSDGRVGLVGNHVYTVSAATTITFNGQDTMLFRIRNPWGVTTGEWKGAWSDNASEWQSVSESIQTSLKVSHKGDGECWIEISDLMYYFEDTNVCSLVPDYDLDGAGDDLNKSCIAFGEWFRDSAAGSDFAVKFDNPRFRFSVPSGLSSNFTMPLIIQFTQERKSRTDRNLAYIRADLFKVESKFSKSTPCEVLYDVTSDKTYRGDPGTAYRYTCTHGEYLIVPNTYEENQERDFMLRLFAPAPLQIKKEEDGPGRFIRRFDMEESFNISSPNGYTMDSLYGEWKGSNSGGQVRHRTFANNPQYVIKVSGSTADVMLSLKQDLSAERIALGIKLIRSDGQYGALDIDYLWRYYNDRGVDTKDGQGTFIIAHDASGLFRLRPGQYTAVLFLNNPGVTKNYIFTVGYLRESAVSTEGFNTVNAEAYVAQ